MCKLVETSKETLVFYEPFYNHTPVLSKTSTMACGSNPVSSNLCCVLSLQPKMAENICSHLQDSMQKETLLKEIFEKFQN